MTVLRTGRTPGVERAGTGVVDAGHRSVVAVAE